MAHVPEPKNFEPKEPVQLNPPKDDPITVAELAKCNGKLPLVSWSSLQCIYYRMMLLVCNRHLC